MKRVDLIREVEASVACSFDTARDMIGTAIRPRAYRNQYRGIAKSRKFWRARTSAR
jgi:hypothetical protein